MSPAHWRPSHAASRSAPACVGSTTETSEVSPRLLVTDASMSKPQVDVGGIPLRQWTVEASFKFAEAAGRHVLLAKNGQPFPRAESPFELAFNAQSGVLRLMALDASGEMRTAQNNNDFTFKPNVWYHVAGVCDGKEMRLLIDAADDGQGYIQHETSPFEDRLAESYGEWSIGRGWQFGQSRRERQIEPGWKSRRRL